MRDLITSFLQVVVLSLCLLQVVAYVCCFKKVHTAVAEVMLVATKNFTFDVLLTAYLLHIALTPPYKALDAMSVVVIAGHTFARFVSKNKANIRNNSKESSELTITSCNLQYGNDVTAICVKDLVSRNPDYIVTLETSDTMYTRIREEMTDYIPVKQGEGRLGELAYIWAHTRVSDNTDFSGVVPVRGTGDLLPLIRVRVRNEQVTLVGVHLTVPDKKAGLEVWSQSFTDLEICVKDTMGSPILAGDFNATMEHSGMRKLNKVLQDSAVSCGVRNSRTWPTDGYVFKKLLPWAVMGLDHVMVSRNLTVERYTEYRVHGSDHKAICVKIRISSE